MTLYNTELGACLQVSIHTPTWGVTSRYCQNGKEHGRFNPHSHMGSDTAKSSSLADTVRFQSTLPHGEWPSLNGLLLVMTCFNPHSHMGSDQYSMMFSIQDEAFQSTLPHGEWRIVGILTHHYSWFQSTLPHGEWLNLQIARETNAMFQSTLPHGEWRQQPVATTQDDGGFNPHSHRGRDGPFLSNCVQLCWFQSTLPHGEWHKKISFNS